MPKLNVDVGTHFDSRMALAKVGIHPPPMAGIWGTPVAESIVISGG